MKPLFMGMLALVLLATACKKERANIDTREPVPPERLKTLTETDSMKVTHYELYYNADGYLSSYTAANKYSTDEQVYRTSTRYERDASHRITRAIQEERNYVYAYHYGEDGRLSEITHIDNGRVTSKTNCSWDRGNLVKVALILPDEYELASRTYAYDSKGNHTSVVYTYYGSSDMYELSFDDRPNYAETVKGRPLGFFSFLGSTTDHSANNITHVRTSLNDSYGDNLEPGTRVLTYNKYGFVEKEVLNGGKRVREFTYEEIK